MFLEDIFGNIETAVNNRRKDLDDKYWKQIHDYECNKEDKKEAKQKENT